MKTEPISLMLFSNEPVRGGAEQVILQLLQGLERKHFRLHLACTPEVAERVRPDLPGDVTLSLLSLDRISDFRGAYQLARALRRYHIQILHSHSFRASLFASTLGRVMRVPVILETSHVREVWRTGWKAHFFIDRAVARQVDGIVAVSEAVAKYLTEEKRVPASKVRVIRNGVDLQRFCPDHAARGRLSQSLSSKEGDPLIVVLGRLERQKGHRILIEAAPAVLREFPNARIVCLGEGSLRSDLERRVQAKGLRHAIRFLGYQTDVTTWLALADVSVLPSFFEGLPLTAIESLAAECPVVATAVDGTPEVVLHKKTGLLVPPGDPDSLAEAILQVFRQPERAREMARAGRKFVVENFSLNKMVRCTQELYLQAWEEHIRRHGGRNSARVPANHHLHPGVAMPAALEALLQVHSHTEATVLRLSSSMAAQTGSSVGEKRPLLLRHQAVKASICDATTDICTSRLGVRLQAIVLTGSLARDEATIVDGGETVTLVGDADFLLVMEQHAVHPSEAELRALAHAVESRLPRSLVTAHVGLGAVSPDYFEKLPPHSFTYELRNCGKVVWGEEKILDRIPQYAPTELSKEDAWRTLNHRIIEVLISAGRASLAGDQSALDLTYAVTKLYLDMATSFLIFAGHYQPTYAARAKQLTSLAVSGQPNHALFDLKQFSQRVSECTASKLTGQHCIANESLTPLLDEAIHYARGLWYWEAHSLGGAEAETSVYSAIAALGGRQTARERLRGWASLARRAGWRIACRNWPRWARLSLVATPRYFIYGSAVQLFWALPHLLENRHRRSDNAIDCGPVRALLPAFPRRSPASYDWCSLTRDIAWNYGTFLCDTLA